VDGDMGDSRNRAHSLPDMVPVRPRLPLSTALAGALAPSWREGDTNWRRALHTATSSINIYNNTLLRGVGGSTLLAFCLHLHNRNSIAPNKR